MWAYPALEEAMRETGLEDMGTYISRHNNTVAQYIVVRPILDLCLEADWRPGLQVTNRWWKHEGLDFAGMWEAEEGDAGPEET